MLELILGGAGTGKTILIYDKIKQAVQAGQQVILLVPEQASFENERQLYRLLGPQKALSVEVLSFTRLCDRVFRAYGGMAGIHMEDSSKLLLMSVALEGLREQLQVYGRETAAPFIESMCELVHELKTAGVIPSQLRQAALEQETEESKNKFYDISLIYEMYQAVIEQGYDDPDDHLLRAVRLLEGKQFFAGTHVFIDGFTAFMGAEWRMLEGIFCGGGILTAALCCENIHTGNGVFAAASATARRLTDLASRCGKKIAAPICLQEPVRFQTAGLKALAEKFPHIRPEKAESSEGVFLTECGDFYDEIEIAASRIAAFVREGYRYREIAVIARDTEPYQAPIETIFSRYHIPYFDDRRSDVVTHPLARGLLYALDAVQSGFESEYVLALSKSCLLGLSAEQGGLLENYCYVWNVTRKTWRTPFENHPDGLKDALNEEASQRLAQANEARAYIMDNLLTLEEDLRDCDGKGFATAVYQYLLNIQAADHLRAAAEEMEPAEAKQLLEDGAQVWDALMGTLDIFGGVLETVRFPLNRFVDLFRLCIGNLQIGILPQTLDQVLIGNADRIRPAEPKAVFVLGLNEGKFPAWTGSSGLLTDGERERLRTAGVDLLHTAEQQALLESYYVYFALTRPSECLYLSYPSWDTAGKGMAKSSAILQAERIFGKTAEPSVSFSPMDRVWSEKSAFDLMARGWREATPEQAALREWFQSRQPERYQALERVSGVHPFALQSEKGKALFAGDLRLSPSRLERYFLCPFSFFCESGLGLRPRRKAEYNPLESGTLIHLVLQQMVEKYGGKGLNSLDDARLREESAAFLDQALKARVNQDMPYRFQYLFARQVDTLAWLLRHLGQEFSQSAFAPVAMELQIREGSPYRPLKLPVFDGSRIIVEGVVDRLDAFEISKRRYLRVVDYKTGIKKFELGDICHGLNMQMLIYLFALCDCYGGLTASYNIPAGVLYMPARADVVEAKRETDPAKIKSMRDAQMKMNGLLLNDRAALSAMECGIKGRFIPARVTSKGELDQKKSSVVSEKQLKMIRGAVEARLKDMANRLKRGRVEALPLQRADQNEGGGICEYCDFAMICLHEGEDPVRELAKLDQKEALQMIEEILNLAEKEEEEDG